MEVFDNKLGDFFNLPENSTRREALLLNRLSYDFQLAAAISDYYLKVYISDVDDNGYDIIIDSEMNTKKLQVKSIMDTSLTESWQISKGLIKPSVNNQRRLIDWQHIDLAGIEGGVVIQRVHLNTETLDVKYFYTDIWVITLFAWGLIGTKRQKNLARKFISKLSGWDYHEKQPLALSLFVEPKNVECLLGLMGFRTRYELSSHRFLMCERYSGKIAPSEHIEKSILQDISRFCEIN